MNRLVKALKCENQDKREEDRIRWEMSTGDESFVSKSSFFVALSILCHGFRLIKRDDYF